MTIRNAFSAFGFEADDATIDTLRTDLAFALRQFIEQSGMRQVKAANVLGLKQSVVSKIVRGDIEHLSVERLIRAMVQANIAGFAEWGGSPELARAGAGLRRPATTSAVVFHMPVDTSGPYFQDIPRPTSNVATVPAVGVRSTDEGGESSEAR